MTRVAPLSALISAIMMALVLLAAPAPAAALEGTGRQLLQAAPVRCNLALCFALDESGSVGQADYSFIVNGLGDEVKAGVFGASSEFSAVEFASSAVLSLAPASPAMRTAVQTGDAIKAFTYSGGSTDTALAIDLCRQQGFLAATNLPKVILLFSDGFPNSESLTTAAANTAKAAGINMATVAFGSFGTTGAAYMASLASTSSITNLPLAYTAPTATDLVAALDSIATSLCAQIQPQPDPDCRANGKTDGVLNKNFICFQQRNDKFKTLCIEPDDAQERVEVTQVGRATWGRCAPTRR